MIVQCYRDGTCEFCHENMLPADDWPDCKIGSYYTVTEAMEALPGWTLFHFAEVPCPPGGWWCSCCFREVDGDKKEWEETLRKHRPHTKELEPA